MMGRPPGQVGRTQLKTEDLVRIQTLSRDARMGPSEIRRVTGYSIHQIKYALKKKTPTIGKRSGRPRKGESSKKKGAEGEDGNAGDDMDVQQGQVTQAQDQTANLQQHPLYQSEVGQQQQQPVYQPVGQQLAQQPTEQAAPQQLPQQVKPEQQLAQLEEFEEEETELVDPEHQLAALQAETQRQS